MAAGESRSVVRKGMNSYPTAPISAVIGAKTKLCDDSDGDDDDSSNNNNSIDIKFTDVLN
jgi:hypothetical protein